MNGWLFIGLVLFGWSVKPYVPKKMSLGAAVIEMVLLLVGAILIAAALS